MGTTLILIAAGVCMVFIAIISAIIASVLFALYNVAKWLWRVITW
jgi:hypothetical protein